MKLLSFYKPIYFVFVILLLSNLSCNNDSEMPIVIDETESLRSMGEELDFVKSKAITLIQNDLGYWEADFGNGVVMIYVPAGSFTMGNNELSSNVISQTYVATPEHKVNLSHYWISKTPITRGQFREFVKTTQFVTEVEKANHSGPWVLDLPSATRFLPKKGYYWDNSYKDIITIFPDLEINDLHPVTCVSWNDAIAFTNWLKQIQGLNYSLPTEAEWEYAARGNDGRIYPWGNDEPDATRANYADETMNKYFPNLEQAIVHYGVTDGFALTSPVGTFPNGRSPIGALDMAGNVTEWIFDSEYNYSSNTQSDPIHLENNGIKMMKAGFWCGSAGRIGVEPDEIDDGHNIRSDARQGDDLNSADDHLGFRIAISYTKRN